MQNFIRNIFDILVLEQLRMFDKQFSTEYSEMFSKQNLECYKN